MQIAVVRPDELGAAHLATWNKLQTDNPELDSPFLSPLFALAVGQIKPQTRVAVLSEESGPVGFFAYELGRRRQANALAMGLSDVQGLVVSSALPTDMGQLMAACDLDLFVFDHLLASQGSRLDDLPRRLSPQGSPAVDLTGGFDDYVRQQKKASRSIFQSTERKRRKLENEHGEIRLCFHEPNHKLLDDVLKWKSNQYRRTGRRDRFANTQTRSLVHALLDTQSATFGAPLTVLYAGDSVVAAHLGLRSLHTLAWWFPMYNPGFAAYSPGLVLLLELAKAMTPINLLLLDLGKGDEGYKRRVANTNINLVEGSVASNRATHTLHTAMTWPARRLTGIVLHSPQLRKVARQMLSLAGRVRPSA